MKAWFSSEPSRLDIYRQITKGAEPRLRVIYADADRDATHIWTDTDAEALELQQEPHGAHVLLMRSGR